MMVFYFLKVEKISSSFTLLYKKSVSLIETIKNDQFFGRRKRIKQNKRIKLPDGKMRNVFSI